MLRRLFNRPAPTAQNKNPPAAESTASIRFASAAIAHIAASFAVMLALAAAAISRGVPPSNLVFPVLFAPVQAVVWFFIVLPLALSPLGDRVTTAPIPGVHNAIVFLLGHLIYFGVFFPVFKAFYRSRIRARRRARGECLRCGYDLRGNISGVCPECGGRVR